MTKEQYDRKCKALFDKADKLGVELIFHSERYEPERLNCLWHGGFLADIIVSDTLIVRLGCYGDVRAELSDEKGEYLAFVKDKGNNGRFYDEMHSYLKNDDELIAAIDSDRLKLGNNNWIEYDGLVRKDTKQEIYDFVDLGMIVDNILDDDILTAINDVLDRLDEIVQEIRDVHGGYGDA